MKKSLYFKNYLVTTCIVFLAFLILTSMFFVWSYRLILRERQKAMSSTAEEVVRYASAMTNSYPVTSFELRISLASFAKMSGFDIMIADETGAIVSTSDMSLMSSELGRVVPFTALQAVESGQDFSWKMVLAVYFLGCMTVFAAGLAALFAAIQVYFRDTLSFLPYFLRIWLYLSPVLWTIDQVPARLAPFMVANPLFSVLGGFGDLLVRGTIPALHIWLLAAAWSVVFAVVGFLFFISREREFAVRL